MSDKFMATRTEGVKNSQVNTKRATAWRRRRQGDKWCKKREGGRGRDSKHFLKGGGLVVKW